MAKYTHSIERKNYIVNGSLVNIPGTHKQFLVNGTLIEIHLHEPYKDSQLNELLYVIIVIVFYATALMTLIITQIKRQRREGTEVDYYDEYLQRNSEVKRTCQAATNIVTKPPSNTNSRRVTAALASAAVAAASAGSILGSEERNETSSLLSEQTEPDSYSGKRAHESGGISSGKLGASASSSFSPNLQLKNVYNPYRGGKVLSRERSPTRILESIPDEDNPQFDV